MVNLLGPCNDALELLEKMYPVEMKDEFYYEHNLKKCGEGPGGQFNGPSLKSILEDKALASMESTLPNYETALTFTNYLRSIRDLHSLCVEKDLDPKYEDIIKNFSDQFYNLFICYNLSMTLKVHVYQGRRKQLKIGWASTK